MLRNFSQRVLALFVVGMGRFYINSVFAALCVGIVVGYLIGAHFK